jgi:SAM-dependent methyltransferase
VDYKWLVRKTSLPGSARTSLFSPNWLISRALYHSVEQSLKYAAGMVVDIGCGSMPYRPLFETTRTIKHYIGVDYLATKHNRDAALASNIINDSIFPRQEPALFATALVLPFTSNSLDTLVSFQVLEHVPDPNKMIAEVYRVLKQEGVTIISTNFIWPLHEEPFDFFRFSKYGLAYLFEQNGFEIIELRAVGGGWMTLGQILSNHITAIFARYKLKLFSFPLSLCIQSLFGSLDWLQPLETTTSHYIVIARKRKKEHVVANLN